MRWASPRRSGVPIGPEGAGRLGREAAPQARYEGPELRGGEGVGSLPPPGAAHFFSPSPERTAPEDTLAQRLNGIVLFTKKEEQQIIQPCDGSVVKREGLDLRSGFIAFLVFIHLIKNILIICVIMMM